MNAMVKDFTPHQIKVSSQQLARIRWRREIDRAHRGGEAAASIADRLDSSVKDIESEIRILEDRPNQIARRPKEIIYEYVVGERSREDLIAVLSEWPYTYGQIGGSPLSSDAWDRGTWDDVTHAEYNGIIDEDAFKQIARAADLPASVFPQWVNGFTRKEPAA